ncbi:MAG: HAD-IIA family hydrolase [Rhodospirillaceae bacterium]
MTFDRAFIDLDGTVYLGGRLIEGVDAELHRLHAQGTRIHYLTNNTSAASGTYLSKLRALNLPVPPDSLVSPLFVLTDWLREREWERVYVVGTAAFRDELETRAGVVQDEVAPQAVIVGFDRELTYAKLETACRLIHAGVPWYITHIDLFCPTEGGGIPDCGAISQLIVATTGVEPAGHFGKPGEHMLRYLRGLVRQGERVLLAGDRVHTDGVIGLALGAETVLVCSGEYQPGSCVVDGRIVIADSLAHYLHGLRTGGSGAVGARMAVP